MLPPPPSFSLDVPEQKGATAAMRGPWLAASDTPPRYWQVGASLAPQPDAEVLGEVRLADDIVPWCRRMADLGAGADGWRIAPGGSQ